MVNLQELDFHNYLDPSQQTYPFTGFQDGNEYALEPAHASNGVPVTNGRVDASLLIPHQQHGFDFSSSFDLATMQGTPISGQGRIQGNIHSPSQSRHMPMLPTHDSLDSGIGMEGGHRLSFDGRSPDMETDAGLGGGKRASSEEKEATPAQNRRKAQNRAAQRAFRERKERHVKELEAKLSALTSKTSSLQNDNERLKLLLQRSQTENEILRATRSPSTSSSLPGTVNDARHKSSGEEHDDDGEEAIDDSEDVDVLHGSSVAVTRYLDAGATWDLLQSHPLFVKGAVDIGEVCERLQKLARCRGSGPVFEERLVRKTIDDLAREPGDTLL